MGKPHCTHTQATRLSQLCTSTREAANQVITPGLITDQQQELCPQRAQHSTQEGGSGGNALPRHQPPRQLEHGRGAELGPQGSGGAQHGACSGLLPRSITQPAFSAAQGANRIDGLTARSFIHTFFKPASKAEQLLSGGARAQREMAPTPRYVSGMHAD